MKKEIEKELINTFEKNYYDNEYSDLIDMFYELLNNIIEPSNNSFSFSKKDIITFLYKKFLDYSKQAFYNLILGNYEMYNACLRILIENYIVLLGIKKGNNMVWKKYYLQSGASLINSFSNKNLSSYNDMIKSFENKKIEFKLTKIKTEDKVFNYDWLSTDTKKIKSFKDACELLDSQVYEDFKFLSNFTHSISYVYKFSKTHYSLLNSISIHLTYISKVINTLNAKVTDKYECLLFDLWCLMGEYIE